MNRLLLAAAAVCVLAACDQPSGPSPARAQWALAEARRTAAVTPEAVGTPGTIRAEKDAAGDAVATAEAAAIDADAAAKEAASTPRVPSRFTKAQFDNFVYGKTKPQIRALFGSPLVVHDEMNEWFYSDLPIYDANAGTQTHVSIRFMNLGGSHDEVVQVRF